AAPAIRFKIGMNRGPFKGRQATETLFFGIWATAQENSQHLLGSRARFGTAAGGRGCGFRTRCRGLVGPEEKVIDRRDTRCREGFLIAFGLALGTRCLM